MKQKDESSWEVHRVSLVDTVTSWTRKLILVCEVKGANLEGIQGVLEPMDKFFQWFPIRVPSGTLSLVNNRSVQVCFYNYSDQPVTIYNDTSVGEFCPAVERGQTISVARNYRNETILDDSDKGTLNCNVLLKQNQIRIQLMT